MTLCVMTLQQCQCCCFGTHLWDAGVRLWRAAAVTCFSCLSQDWFCSSLCFNKDLSDQRMVLDCVWSIAAVNVGDLFGIWESPRLPPRGLCWHPNLVMGFHFLLMLTFSPASRLLQVSLCVLHPFCCQVSLGTLEPKCRSGRESKVFLIAFRFHIVCSHSS